MNVLVASVVSSHAHHSVAQEWFATTLASAADDVVIAEETLASMVRVVTMPHVSPTFLALAASLTFDPLISSGRVRLIRPGERRLALFRDLLHDGEVRGKLVPDAYLAAQAMEIGATMITFDRDSLRFEGLHVELLRPLGSPPL